MEETTGTSKATGTCASVCRQLCGHTREVSLSLPVLRELSDKKRSRVYRWPTLLGLFPRSRNEWGWISSVLLMGSTLGASQMFCRHRNRLGVLRKCTFRFRRSFQGYDSPSPTDSQELLVVQGPQCYACWGPRGHFGNLWDGFELPQLPARCTSHESMCESTPSVKNCHTHPQIQLTLHINRSFLLT